MAMISLSEANLKCSPLFVAASRRFFSVALSKVVDFIVAMGLSEFDVTLDLVPPKFVNNRVLPMSTTSVHTPMRRIRIFLEPLSRVALDKSATNPITRGRGNF